MITKELDRPICIVCKIRPTRSAGKSVRGHELWRKHCASCDSMKHRRERVVELTCTICGFIAADCCQIDTVEGHSVCSNCNRLRIKQKKHHKRQHYELTVDATVNSDDITL
jgi:hypothetical protein